MNAKIRILYCLTVILISQTVGKAQDSNESKTAWVTQEFTDIKRGWNAIYLHVDASHAPIKEILGKQNIKKVWAWMPKNNSVQFVQSPQSPSEESSNWLKWSDNPNTVSDLEELYPNTAYLIYSSADEARTIKIKGRPVAPQYIWSITGLNLIGFPTPSPSYSGSPSFGSFLQFSENLRNQSEIFIYNGGELNDGTTPKRLNRYNETLRRGQAFWIRGRDDQFNEYYGPVDLTLQDSDGIHFGQSLSAYRINFKNVANKTVTVRISSKLSEPSPNNEKANQPKIMILGDLDPIVLDYKIESLDSRGIQFDLNPSKKLGDTREINLSLDRKSMINDGFEYYAGLIQIETSINGKVYTEIILPATARDPSMEGLWLGEAVVTEVRHDLTQYKKENDEQQDLSDEQVDEKIKKFKVKSSTPDAYGHQTVTIDEPHGIVTENKYELEIYNDQNYNSTRIIDSDWIQKNIADDKSIRLPFDSQKPIISSKAMIKVTQIEDSSPGAIGTYSLDRKVLSGKEELNISSWIKVNSLPETGNVYGIVGEQSSDNQGVSFGLKDNGSLYFFDGLNQYSTKSTNVIPNQWSHVSVNYKGKKDANKKIKINKIEKGYGDIRIQEIREYDKNPGDQPGGIMEVITKEPIFLMNNIEISFIKDDGEKLFVNDNRWIDVEITQESSLRFNVTSDVNKKDFDQFKNKLLLIRDKKYDVRSIEILDQSLVARIPGDKSPYRVGERITFETIRNPYFTNNIFTVSEILNFFDGFVYIKFSDNVEQGEDYSSFIQMRRAPFYTVSLFYEDKEIEDINFAEKIYISGAKEHVFNKIFKKEAWAVYQLKTGINLYKFRIELNSHYETASHSKNGISAQVTTNALKSVKQTTDHDINIDKIRKQGDSVIVTTRDNHNFNEGDIVKIHGSKKELNGFYKINDPRRKTFIFKPENIERDWNFKKEDIVKSGNVFAYIEGNGNGNSIEVRTGITISANKSYIVKVLTGNPIGEIEQGDSTLSAWIALGDDDVDKSVSRQGRGYLINYINSKSNPSKWKFAEDGEWIENELVFKGDSKVIIGFENDDQEKPIYGDDAISGKELVIMASITNKDVNNGVYFDNFRVFEINNDNNQINLKFEDSFEKAGVTQGVEGELVDSGWVVSGGNKERTGLLWPGIGDKVQFTDKSINVARALGEVKVEMADMHSFNELDFVEITGANETEFNDIFKITRSDESSFNFLINPLAGDPTGDFIVSNAPHVNFFVNGKKTDNYILSNNSPSYQQTPLSSSNTLIGGVGNNLSSEIDGVLTKLRIYSIALSNNQVRFDYESKFDEIENQFTNRTISSGPFEVQSSAGALDVDGLRPIGRDSSFGKVKRPYRLRYLFHQASNGKLHMLQKVYIQPKKPKNVALGRYSGSGIAKVNVKKNIEYKIVLGSNEEFISNGNDKYYSSTTFKAQSDFITLRGKPQLDMTASLVENNKSILTTRISNLDKNRLSQASRMSIVHLPLSNVKISPAENSKDNTLTANGNIDFLVPILYDDHSSNPFIHTYHPDHDNYKNSDYSEGISTTEAEGIESWGITRKLNFVFNDVISQSEDINREFFRPSQWGTSLFGGKYYETILFKDANGSSKQHEVKGIFTLKRLNSIGELDASK